jgi:predicted alpha/beta hydrolase family esterase
MSSEAPPATNAPVASAPAAVITTPPVPKKAILLPGNGTPPSVVSLDDCGFYTTVQTILKQHGIPMPLPAFPDGYVGHEDAWTAFCLDELGLDETTLLVGHSTGSACALRLMEQHKVAGCVLVAAYYTDLGDSMERESGYFDRPWDWAAIKRNAPWVLQFHSKNDQLVPIAEARYVAERIGSEFVVSKNEGHFVEERSRTIEPALIKKLQEIGCTPQQR